MQTFFGTIAALVLFAGAAIAQGSNPASSAPGNATGQTSLSEQLAQRLNENTVTVISGEPNGTYLHFAFDMSAVLDDGHTLRVLPVVGKGAAQNMKDLLYLKEIDMGITQSDILRHFEQTGEVGGNIADRIRYIARLYNEEMHVLGQSRFKTIADLKGKKVNFGKLGSGTQISSRLIFKALGIEVEEINIEQPAAFEAIKRGEIAATILFGGKPTGVFAQIAADPTYKLLNVPYDSPIHEDYLPSSLTHEDYPALVPQGEEVKTVSVGSVLAVFNWAPDSDRYRRVSSFTEALFKNFGAFLKKPRHPKWQEVNLAADLPGWKRFGAAQSFLDRNLLSEIKPGAFDQLITGSSTPAGSTEDTQQQREALFRAFMKWKQEREAR